VGPYAARPAPACAQPEPPETHADHAVQPHRNRHGPTVEPTKALARNPDPLINSATPSGPNSSSNSRGARRASKLATFKAARQPALDLHDAILVGHSTGGGEVTRYIGRHGTSRVAKAVLLSAVPPLMLKTEANPGGTPIEAFDAIRAGVTADRSQFYKERSAPFYGANREAPRSRRASATRSG
jgi:pimeloyl-ACP methyl ester carboxylesterase